MDNDHTNITKDSAPANINLVGNLRETPVLSLGNLPVSAGYVPDIKTGTKGFGESHSHIGEFLQGEISHSNKAGRIKFLITAAIPALQGSIVEFTLDLEDPTITTNPEEYTKSARVARAMLDELGLKNAGGDLAIRTYVPDGKGLGASTANCNAVANAVCMAVRGPNFTPDPDVIAKIIVAAEGAADSVMYPTQKPVVFAQTEGVVLQTFSRALPEMKILAFDTAPDDRVETDHIARPVYSDHQIKSFECAIELFEYAIETQSVNLIGRIATFSATVSENALENPLRKPHFDRILKLKDLCGAAGVLVSHSGTVAGFIFDPEIKGLPWRIALARLGIFHLGFGPAQLFSTAT